MAEPPTRVPPLPRIVALVPAHNEAASIEATLTALLGQQRLPDLIVVVADNCTDATVALATAFAAPVTVIESVGNTHKKSGALNQAWRRYCQDADLVICLDADTVLPPNAVGDWEKEFAATPLLAGSSSKFTMLGSPLLVRLQRAEFAKWTDSSLRRGWTSVLAGTGCMIRNDALRQIAARDDREGPWAYTSQVEDFELTYRIREGGWLCQVSPKVRAYTDAMRTMRTLWAQRMKWQVGTVEDLLKFGVRRLTLLDWRQQVAGMLTGAVRFLWLATTVVYALAGTLSVSWLWFVLPLLFVANDVRQALRIPHRDLKDVLLAAVLLPHELFAWMRAGWFLTAWTEVLLGKITRRRRDHWKIQYAVEGV
jgi:biofilm PGA synthesis N-glycosyltransferase PgaC